MFNNFKKILFLDHDGVIVLDGKNFEPKAVKLLKEIIEETKCDVCISSAWRKYMPFFTLQSLYRSHGLKTPIGYTPIDISHVDDRPHIRGEEIDKWLSHWPVENWVAVDDMDLSPYCKSFVKCDPTFGLTEKEAEDIIKILCK